MPTEAIRELKDLMEFITEHPYGTWCDMYELLITRIDKRIEALEELLPKPEDIYKERFEQEDIELNNIHLEEQEG